LDDLRVAIDQSEFPGADFGEFEASRLPAQRKKYFPLHRAGCEGVKDLVTTRAKGLYAMYGNGRRTIFCFKRSLFIYFSLFLFGCSKIDRPPP